MTASGTAGFADELARVSDLAAIGAVVTKTATSNPREGNATPRTVETPSGMLNSIGLPNPGLEGIVRSYQRRWQAMPPAVVVSLAGYSLAEFASMARMLEGVPGVDAIEANFSCPNVANGLEFATDADLLSAAVATIRDNCSLPLLAKLSPNVTDMRPLALAAQAAGANGLTIMNTVLGMKIDPASRRPLLGGVFGGLSGPAIRPLGVRFVFEVYPEVDIPIVGVGGISGLEDALEYILAGAAAIQLGTINFVAADRAALLAEGIKRYCGEAGVDSLADIVGLAHRGG
ncbi:MAG: dihydroorotate dehydrogenase [Chloroflexi bacterium]|nr:dihydroorotate dehydrogenase [Chloroflexota bacterium]MXX99324.1 dihydroorotate dehydrogenase [Chloroflexota bacterium]MYB17044.1 dihydroorotate dehydrogenase [Chloroflexota bacterium]MYC48191.1 dihydroorotate dehydrogenase [Chloroflexota bacterium]